MMSTAIMQILLNEYEVRTYSVKRVTHRDSKSDSRERESQLRTGSKYIGFQLATLLFSIMTYD